MRTIKLLAGFMLLAVITGSCNRESGLNKDYTTSPYNVMKEIHWADVRWTEGFWADKFELCRKEIIPAVYNGLMHPDNSEHLSNLKIAAGMEEGKFKGLDWSDGDCYKWIESMAFMYAVTKDPELDKTMDEWISVIAKAQQPDGYISTNMTLRGRTPYMQHPNPKTFGGTYHEMYNIGHLLTAACNHYRATGKTNFLAVAKKLADHFEKVFKPGAPELRVMAGNLPTLMGLVDMYRVTGDKKYLKASQIGIDVRGTLPLKSDLCQDHVPFREETEAVGHSVFATYLYAGAVDIVAETGEKALRDALDRIWQSAANRRTYITGGACAIPNGVSARGDDVHEAFGADYQLPSRTAYNETCANIGNAMWNWRMLLLTGEAKYGDILEQVIYNSGLSGVSLDGRNFFYANPLEWNFNREGLTKHFTEARWPIHSCYCCPPQIARTIAGIGRWAYTVSDGKLWIHIYGGNTLETKMPDGSLIAVSQKSQYPWDGTVKLSVNKISVKAVSIMLRIPGWVESASLKINGEEFSGSLTPGTYVEINRKWKPGDEIVLDLPMPVRVMAANPKVEDCVNKVAFMRGPLVYCAEFPVNDGGKDIWEKGVYLPANPSFTANTEKDFLGGLVVLTGRAMDGSDYKKLLKSSGKNTAKADQPDWSDGALFKKLSLNYQDSVPPGSIDLKLIPYFAWANRGPAYMTVWIPYTAGLPKKQ
jgi:DUF1680 family protein